MRLHPSLLRFWTDRTGAVLSDWLLLVAATVGASAAVASAVQSGNASLRDNLGAMFATSAALLRDALDLEDTACPTVAAEGSTVTWSNPGAATRT